LTRSRMAAFEVITEACWLGVHGSFSLRFPSLHSSVTES
jgi:hypothetical protein